MISFIVGLASPLLMALLWWWPEQQLVILIVRPKHHKIDCL